MVWTDGVALVTMLDTRRHVTVRSFLAASQDFLLRREAEHCLLLGICDDLPESAFAHDGPWLATAESDGVVGGVGLHAGPFDVVLSHLAHPDAAHALCDQLVDAGRSIPGVFGVHRDAHSFARRWSERHGGTFRSDSDERIHRLTKVIQPPSAPGAPRVASTSDRPLMTRWMVAFQEAVGQGSQDPDVAVDRFLGPARHRLWLWEVDGKPVSMAGAQGATPSGIRIGAVYTPPEHRGRGYASNLVASLSQAELEGGRRECYLYTDLGNPTSNHIYASIGYQPVADVVHMRFVP